MAALGSTTDPDLRDAVRSAGALPLPGRGHTVHRLAGLAALGEGDLSVARIAEGHADAVAILADARRTPRPGCVYGVWASVAPDGDVRAEASGGGWILHGTKPFCSGAATCDRALLRCGDLLVDVDLRHPGARPVDGTWPAVGMAGSDGRAVAFDGVAVTADEVVGTTAWYLGRPGFRHGGIGVAAVWAGAARAVLRSAASTLDASSGDAELAALGAAAAAVGSAEALLDAAAAAIDADPDDASGDARRLAALTRHGVHAAACETLRASAAAGGARSLCLDAGNARRVPDLWAYLTQHHPGRDAATLGRLVLQAGVDPGATR